MTGKWLEKRDAEKQAQTFRISLSQKSKFPRFRGIEEVIGMEREQQSDNSWHTIVIVLSCCGVIKMLHLLGVISVEGESLLSV